MLQYISVCYYINCILLPTLPIEYSSEGSDSNEYNDYTDDCWYQAIIFPLGKAHILRNRLHFLVLQHLMSRFKHLEYQWCYR